MENNLTVTINAEGQTVITQDTPLLDYSLQRARMLRSMAEIVAAAKTTREGTYTLPSSLIRPMMELIRMHTAEVEPLMRALDRRAYEKGFDDGRKIGHPSLIQPRQTA
jgi:hypothetical protein